MILTIALHHGWILRQLDVNNAFLHGELEETIYLHQPPGFTDSMFPDHVCKLNKALYGLKQAPRAWFNKLKDFLLQQQFVCSQADSSLFIFRSDHTVVYLLVYVDDIIVTGNQPQQIQTFLHTLAAQFSIRDLGTIHHFLGIEILSSDKTLVLSQTQYLKTILARAHMTTAKPCKTPLESGLQLSKFDGQLFSDPSLYRQIVGSLQYATITRPDLTFAVNKVAQFMAQPTDRHWQVVKRILRYINGTLDLGLTLTSAPKITLNAYCDADWAGCPDDRRSTTGYAVFLGPNLVSWVSKKQNTVSRSSTEAEYRSMAMATCELQWLQSLLQELGQSFSSSPTLWCDNLGATFLAANPVFHARTKHIELDFHFVREKVASKQLTVQFLCSQDQIADILTKSLAKGRFLLLRDKLTVSVRPMSLRGPIGVNEEHSTGDDISGDHNSTDKLKTGQDS